jgi:hypothetical protein
MADQQNDKIIKNFKRRDVNTRRQLHDFINAMCEEAKGGEIEAILLGKGMMPCVAREWGNEHRRRDYLLQQAIKRKYRKETSSFGKRGQDYRRIIASTIRKGRLLEFHATKGLRDCRVPA